MSSRLVWAIPGAGKSTFVDNNPHLDIVDFDAWQRAYGKKHPKLLKKVGFEKYLALCLKSCRKHNSNSIILTSKLSHVEIADVVIVHFNIEKFVKSTTRPNREVWGYNKCSQRLSDYKQIIAEHNIQYYEMLDDEFFSDTLQRIKILQ